MRGDSLALSRAPPSPLSPRVYAIARACVQTTGADITREKQTDRQTDRQTERERERERERRRKSRSEKSEKEKGKKDFAK